MVGSDGLGIRDTHHCLEGYRCLTYRALVAPAALCAAALCPRRERVIVNDRDQSKSIGRANYSAVLYGILGYPVQRHCRAHSIIFGRARDHKADEDVDVLHLID